MSQLSNILTAAVHSSANRRTERKMIVLKNRKQYIRCMEALKQQGIDPIKKIGSANTLCCHLDLSKSTPSLLQHPHIRTIETDCTVKVHGKAFTDNINASSLNRIPWGVQAIHAPQIWNSTRGQGVKIGVIDTGLSPHPDLVIAGGYNAIHRNFAYADDNGHGTHVAGIAAAVGHRGLPYGVAPKVQLYGIKALDANGDGFVSDIVEGVEWCIANGMHIINMSLGLDGPSDALRASIRKAHRRGIIVVASAGNSGPFNIAIDQPASYPETIAVAATNRHRRIPTFSSRGYGIDVVAPGDKIVSTDHKRGFSVDSGTSMAAPHVSGTIALLLSKQPFLQPEQIRRLLKQTATSLLKENEQAQGAGLIDAKLAIQELSTAVAASYRRKPLHASKARHRIKPSTSQRIDSLARVSKHKRPAGTNNARLFNNRLNPRRRTQTK